MEEEWKQIEEYSNYSISNLGNVKNNKTGRILKQSLTAQKYYGVSIYNDNKKQKTHLIHILLANYFITKIEGKEYIDHIDRNRQNNKLDNLRWVSCSENNINSKKRNNCSSKYKGVYFCKSKKKWCVDCSYNYKKLKKRFNTEEEAALAYNNFMINNNAKNALLNEIPI